MSSSLNGTEAQKPGAEYWDGNGRGGAQSAPDVGGRVQGIPYPEQWQKVAEGLVASWGNGKGVRSNALQAPQQSQIAKPQG